MILVSILDESMLESIQDIAMKFFEKLWVHFEDISVTQESQKIYRVAIKSDDSNLIIGPHGKNLDAISHILKLLVSKSSGQHMMIHVEVNDYLEKKDLKLQAFIKTKIELVKNSGSEITLPFFTAYERKKVHSYVSEIGWNIVTKSIWEGKERRIHLSRKEEKMTIDIDGDDI